MDETLLREHRRAKDEHFRRGHHSPIPPGDRAGFGGLDYYPPRADLDLELELLPAGDGEIRVPTSDGRERVYRRAGRVRFAVDGEEAELTLFSVPGHEEGGLFLPFRDATSGDETYGAGRYLDLDSPQEGRVRVDFNLAYNPFCAYDEAYSCPLPPPENWLRVPIRAGEKAYAPEG